MCPADCPSAIGSFGHLDRTKTPQSIVFCGLLHVISLKERLLPVELMFISVD
jgi:hypothetical protein